MKTNLTNFVYARTIPVCAALACLLLLGLAPIAGPKANLPSQPPAAPASRPAGVSNVMVYVKMVIERKYGILAHIVGKRDYTERDIVYDAQKSWWDNPLVAYADAPFVRDDAPLAHTDVVGETDAETIAGASRSSNADVALTLIPHAVVTLRSTPRSDCIKGTITVSIDTVDDYFDGAWTELVRTIDKPLTFSFDTCDPGRQLEQIVHETRTIPTFAVERYTRDHEKWESRSHWPNEFRTGDTRVVIYGRDATLNVTGYRYAAR
jgi:hypothetical protein